MSYEKILYSAATQARSNDHCLKTVETHEYKPGEVVPVTSSLYHVVHDPLNGGESLQTFHAGDQFPPCPKCGIKVRYLIRTSMLI